MDKIIRVEDYPSFGYWLRRRRKALDLTQADLAGRAGCSAATIRKIEADERKPSLQLAELLAEALQIPEGQQGAFVQFARGVGVTGETGLEALEGDWGDVDAAPDEAGILLPNNLPPQTTPFFGRTAELETLEGFLADPDKRLVTVLGPGGMGKTRLSIAAAEGRLNDPPSAERFPDGIYFVPLAGVESADFLTAAVAEALDFQFSGADDPGAQLLRYLQSRKMLLVLDNFEHLLAGAGPVQEILDTAPAIELLVTSREKLNLQAEQLLPIGGLTYPLDEEPLTVEEAVTYSAMQLFVERAISIRPSFALSEENLHAAAAICRLVAGMPLGIVLAAAWIDTLAAAEIAREIGRDLDFLETEMGDVPPRQRSLHAAFNYSWRMLTLEEQEIYSQLSVFRSGFTAEPATAVAGASFRNLQNLVNKSLLARVSSGEKGAGRYEIHELLRQLAALELAKKPDLQAAARDRHSEYYCSLLARIESDWRSDKQMITLKITLQESDNITAALRVALEAGAWQRLARAIDSWGLYHQWRGLFTDGRVICEEIESNMALLDRAGVMDFLERSCLLAKTLAWQGVFNTATEKALAKLEESLSLLDEVPPAAWDVRAVRAFVLLHMAARYVPVDLKRAHQFVEESLAISLEISDQWLTAYAYHWLGSIEYRFGHVADARKYMATSLAMFRKLGDMRMEVFPLIMLGWTILHEGDFQGAERLRYQALDLCRQVGDRSNLIYCINDLAWTLAAQGKFEEAYQAAYQAVTLCVEFGHRDKEGLTRGNLGFTLMQKGRYDQARQTLDLALALARETGNQDVESGNLVYLGLLELIEGGNIPQAKNNFSQALQIHERTQDVVFLPFKLGGMGLACCIAGDLKSAGHFLKSSLQLQLSMREYPQMLRTLPYIAFFLILKGDVDKGLEIWALMNSKPFVANSQWYADVLGRRIKNYAAALPADQVAAAEKRGHARDLWQTAESLLTYLTGDSE